MAAPFRICRPLSKAQRTALPETPSPDSYVARLLKLVPAEVIALYLAGRGVILSNADPVAGTTPKTALLIWTVIGLAAVIALRWWGTGDRGRGEPPQTAAVVISALSFLVWIYSLGDVFTDFGIHDPKLAALIVIAWTFSIPLFYRGTRPQVAVLPPG